MQVLSSATAELTAEYGIRIGRWSQYPGSDRLPFKAMWCEIAPGSSSSPDRHPEVELAVVVNGDATFAVEGVDVPAPLGTAVLFSSEEGHVIHNNSAELPLVILSVYWLPEDAPKGEETRDER